MTRFPPTLGDSDMVCELLMFCNRIIEAEDGPFDLDDFYALALAMVEPDQVMLKAAIHLSNAAYLQHHNNDYDSDSEADFVTQPDGEAPAAIQAARLACDILLTEEVCKNPYWAKLLFDTTTEIFSATQFFDLTCVTQMLQLAYLYETCKRSERTLGILIHLFEARTAMLENNYVEVIRFVHAVRSDLANDGTLLGSSDHVEFLQCVLNKLSFSIIQVIASFDDNIPGRDMFCMALEILNNCVCIIDSCAAVVNPIAALEYEGMARAVFSRFENCVLSQMIIMDQFKFDIDRWLSETRLRSVVSSIMIKNLQAKVWTYHRDTAQVIVHFESCLTMALQYGQHALFKKTLLDLTNALLILGHEGVTITQSLRSDFDNLRADLSEDIVTHVFTNFCAAQATQPWIAKLYCLAIQQFISDLNKSARNPDNTLRVRHQVQAQRLSEALLVTTTSFYGGPRFSRFGIFSNEAIRAAVLQEEVVSHMNGMRLG